MACVISENAFLYAFSVELWTPGIAAPPYPPIYNKTYYYVDGDGHSAGGMTMKGHFDAASSKPTQCINVSEPTVYIPKADIKAENFIAAHCWVVAQSETVNNFNGSNWFSIPLGILLEENSLFSPGFGAGVGSLPTSVGNFAIYGQEFGAPHGSILSYFFPMNGDSENNFDFSAIGIFLEGSLNFEGYTVDFPIPLEG